MKGSEERLQELAKESLLLDEARSALLERVKELTAISALTGAITSSRSLDEVLLTVYKYTLSLVGADLSVVYLLEGDRLVLPKARPGNPRFLAETPETKRVGECLCGLVVLDKVPIYAKDVFSDTRCTLEERKRVGIRSFAGLPLVAGRDMLGVLGIGSFAEQDFSARAIFLETIAGHVAIALQNALLHEEMERKTAELERILSERRRVEEALRKNEATLKTIFRAAPIGIGLVKDRIIGWTNEQLWRMTGYSGAELAGRSALMLYESKEEFERVASVKHPQVLEHGTGTMETRWRHKDGRVMDILLSSSSIVPGDLSRGLVFTAMDISDRKRAEEALRESEEKYRLVVENSNDAVFIAQDERIQFPNTKTLNLAGYSEEEISTMPFVEIIHPEDRELVLERYRRRIQGEQVPTTYSFRILHKNGSELWVQLNAVLIHWEGRPATLNFLRDITQQRRLEGQLRQAQKMEAIGTLAGGIAHDFNNILTPIIVRTEIALMDVPQISPIRGHLEEVLKAAERARDLVRQILTFSRQGEDQKKPLRMSLMVKEVLKFLRSSLPSTIEIRQEIMTEAAVLADPSQVHQVIMNLCTNAAHAMRQRGGLLELKLNEVMVDSGVSNIVPGLEAGHYVQLKVRDTGAGMDPWVMEKIFDPYFTTKDKGEGTGLGLSVVHGIVTGLGGAITVQSEPGEGSTFTLFIPRIAAGARPEGPEPEVLLRGGHERVLLVDDERTMLESFAEMLLKLGYHLDSRTDPLEALDAFRKDPQRYDVLITDQTMPGMTGAELARESLLIRPDLPIILCTGYSELITEEMARAIGIRQFVMKPIVMHEMAETIRKALEGKRREG